MSSVRVETTAGATILPVGDAAFDADYLRARHMQRAEGQTPGWDSKLP